MILHLRSCQHLHRRVIARHCTSVDISIRDRLCTRAAMTWFTSPCGPGKLAQCPAHLKFGISTDAC
eukprot:8335225-Alexandrium_andersonii.AAC.1